MPRIVSVPLCIDGPGCVLVRAGLCAGLVGSLVVVLVGLARALLGGCTECRGIIPNGRNATPSRNRVNSEPAFVNVPELASGARIKSVRAWGLLSHASDGQNGVKGEILECFWSTVQWSGRGGAGRAKLFYQ